METSISIPQHIHLCVDVQKVNLHGAGLRNGKKGQHIFFLNKGGFVPSINRKEKMGWRLMKIDFFFPLLNRNETLRLHITSLFITMAADKTTTGHHYSDKMNSFMQKQNSHAVISSPSSAPPSSLPLSLPPYLVNQKPQCSFMFCKKSFEKFLPKKKKKALTTLNSSSQAEYMQGYKADIVVANTLRLQMLMIHAPAERDFAGCHFRVAHTPPNPHLIIIISHVIDSSVC